MNIKSFILLLAFVLVGAGAYFYSGSKQSINAADSIGNAILPELLAALNNINELEVTGSGDRILSTIIRTDAGWKVKQRNSYPADISKVRSALLNLAEAKIVEEKTSNSDLYTKLGVEDLSINEAQGIKAAVKYNNQTTELIVGKPGPQINKTRYVRPANSETSWLIDRKIDLKHEPEYWLKKDILSIEPSDVAAVTIVLEDGAELKITNKLDEDDNFEVVNLSDPNSQVIAAELHQVTNALSSFQLLDVSTEQQFKDATPSMNVSYLLKTGVTIGLIAYDKDGVRYASVESNISADIANDKKAAAQSYVDELNAITSGWVYKIPNVTYDSMYKREADVLAITEDQLN